MSTYTQIQYHIVFATKYREPLLPHEGHPELFKYIWGILQKKNCKLLRINAVEDHIHILTHLHPSVPLADLVKHIKVASTLWIKEHNIIPRWKGWQEGYGAFTTRVTEQQQLINYIKNQQRHHPRISFEGELKSLLREHQVPFDPKYFP